MVRPLLVLAALGAPLAAQEPARVPVDLEFAATGGGFQSDSGWVRYRVLVYSGGFDHIVSEFHLQWIRDPSEEDSAKVISSVPIAELNGFWRVAGAPVFGRSANRTTLVIDVINPHQARGARRQCVITPGAPSKYVIKCGR